MDENNSIQLFEDRKIRTAWDEEKEEWYFSVVDVVAVLSDSANPTDYLKKMRKRDEQLASYLGTNCPQVEMTGSTGKSERCLPPIRNRFCASSSPSPRPRQNRSSVGWHRLVVSASRRPSTRSRPSTGRWRPIRRRAMTPTGSTSASSPSASATSSPPNGRRGAWSRAGNTPSSPTRSQRPGPA